MSRVYYSRLTVLHTLLGGTITGHGGSSGRRAADQPAVAARCVTEHDEVDVYMPSQACKRSLVRKTLPGKWWISIGLSNNLGAGW